MKISTGIFTFHLCRALLEADTGAEAATRGREAVETLNYSLCNLSQLYEFAKLFQLHEVKLAVLHCAGRFDQEIVQNVWRDLLQKGCGQLWHLAMIDQFPRRSRTPQFPIEPSRDGGHSEEFILNSASTGQALRVVAPIRANGSVDHLMIISLNRSPQLITCPFRVYSS
jgi:hypothetical protein